MSDVTSVNYYDGAKGSIRQWVGEKSPAIPQCAYLGVKSSVYMSVRSRELKQFTHSGTRVRKHGSRATQPITIEHWCIRYATLIMKDEQSACEITWIPYETTTS